MGSLPVQNFRSKIITAIADKNRLIITAPTGSGKSTQVPQNLYRVRNNADGKVIVLQPRRLAAVGLAHRIAEEMDEKIGETVGYQVRGDSRIGKHTSIIFQTYGFFVRSLLKNPALTGVSTVILDEFHERQLDMDVSIAWLKHLQVHLNSPVKIIVMSATLNMDKLSRYLDGSRHIDILSRQYDVEIGNQTPVVSEKVWEQAIRAFKTIASNGISGTVLVFMPGIFEIERCMEHFLPICLNTKWELLHLHGGLRLSDQKKILSPENADGNRVVVTTNVAESSLTIPGVTVVIDSGLARVAGYNPHNGINTLYLKKISLANAAQRTGRAGRLAPGHCVRLWAKESETAMEPDQIPEIKRLDVTQIQLMVRYLLNQVVVSHGVGNYLLDWLDSPLKDLWNKGLAQLTNIGAISDDETLLPTGRELVKYPIHPALARVLTDGIKAGAGEMAAAMAALVSTGHQVKGRNYNLVEMASDLLVGRGSWPRLVQENYRQLKNQLPKSSQQSADHTELLEESLLKTWLRIFPDGLGVHTGQAANYTFADGRAASLTNPPAELPKIILSVDLHETGNARGRKRMIHMWLRAEQSWVEATFPGELKHNPWCGWDEKRSAVTAETHITFRELVIESRRIEGAVPDSSLAEDMLVEKLLSGDVVLKQADEKFEQLKIRLKLLAETYPEYNFPKLDQEDWRLIYHELCGGKTSLADLNKANLKKILKDYSGDMAVGMLNPTLPQNLTFLIHLPNSPPVWAILLE